MSLFGALVEQRFGSIGPEPISQNPSQSLLSALGADLTAAGIPMNPAIAETIPVVYACVAFRARMVGQLPLVLYKRTANGRERAREHSLYSVLHDLPNPEMTPFIVKSTMERWKWLWGDAYAEIIRDNSGNVKQLWPLRSDMMEVTRDRFNRLTYIYHLPGGDPIVWTFDARHPPIHHLRINSLDGIHGRSPIRMLRDLLGFSKATEGYGQKFYTNNSRPAGIIKGPAGVQIKPDTARQMREDWERFHRGADNAHRVAVLQNGYEFQPIALSPVDAQFIETVECNDERLAMMFALPPHVVGLLRRATNNNIEHQGLELTTLHLTPDLVDWEEAIGRDMLGAKSFETHYAKFTVDALMRGDAKSRAETLAIKRQAGVITANEWREKDDENRIPAEEGGDALLVNGNMIPLTTAMQAERQAEPFEPAEPL